MYLVTNNLELSADEFKTLYRKRWSMKEYHKSLKQNASFVQVANKNGTFASLLAYIKPEKLKFANKLNHFALKAKIYLAASKIARNELTVNFQDAKIHSIFLKYKTFTEMFLETIADKQF